MPMRSSNALAPVVPSLEQRASDQIAALSNLDQLESSRQALLQTLNGPAGRVVLRPFLPQDILAAQTCNYVQRSNGYERSDRPGCFGRSLPSSMRADR